MYYLAARGVEQVARAIDSSVAEEEGVGIVFGGFWQIRKGGERPRILASPRY